MGLASLRWRGKEKAPSLSLTVVSGFYDHPMRVSPMFQAMVKEAIVG